MAKRLNSANIIARRINMLRQNIIGRESASSSTLSVSYGLPVEQVKKMLEAQGVSDNG